MLTVLVTNLKGGCGKTTIATNLAGAFANMGLETVLADCDRQRSSLSWAGSRPEAAVPLKAVDWGKDIGKTAKKTQRLVIDAPAGIRRAQTQELVKMADVVVLPVLPSVFDENATRKFLATLDKLKPVRKGRRAVAVVGNRVRTHTRTADQLETFFEGTEHPVVTRLRDSQLYPSLAASGLTLFDRDTTRTRGFTEDWRPLLSFLDENAVRLGA